MIEIPEKRVALLLSVMEDAIAHLDILFRE